MRTEWLEILDRAGIGYLARLADAEGVRPLLVMIPGAGGSAQVWLNQVRGLADGLDCLALDLPGHGRSEGAAMPSVAAYGAWLADLLGRLAAERVALMGHSMGGAVAMETALAAPSRVKALVLVGTGARLKVAPQILEGLTARFDATVALIMRNAYGPAADQAWVREGERLMRAAGQTVVRKDFEACEAFDRTDELGRIAMPCLVACGREDRLTPPALSEALCRAIAGSRLALIEGAGHMVMIEKFADLNREVAAFCARCRELQPKGPPFAP